MRKQLIISILLIFPCITSAQVVYDLKGCIQQGLENNYAIQISRNQESVSNNNLTIGNAGYLPSVNLNSGYSGTINNTEQRLVAGGTNKNNGVHNQNINAGINLDWTIFDGFNIQTNHSRLKELRQLGELNTRLTIENFISNITVEYYNYIQQSIRLDNLRSAVKLSKERLRIVEARYNIGAVSRLDLQQAKVDFNSDSSRLIKQHEVLYSSRTKFNNMMSVDDVEQAFITTDSVIEYNTLLNREAIWSNTLAGNTYLLLSKSDKTLSVLDLKTAQSGNYPYLKLTAGYGYTQNRYEVGTYDRQYNTGFNYGVTLGFNLFDGFNRKREQKNARIQIESTELKYLDLELAIKTDLANIWMAYQNNIDLTSLEQENVQTAKENYDIAIERYMLGDLSGIELREAQNSLLEAEERLVQAQYNTKLCEISLFQISGSITSYLYDNIK